MTTIHRGCKQLLISDKADKAQTYEELDTHNTNTMKRQTPVLRGFEVAGDDALMPANLLQEEVHVHSDCEQTKRQSLHGCWHAATVQRCVHGINP